MVWDPKPQVSIEKPCLIHHTYKRRFSVTKVHSLTCQYIERCWRNIWLALMVNCAKDDLALCLPTAMILLVQKLDKICRCCAGLTLICILTLRTPSLEQPATSNIQICWLFKKPLVHWFCLYFYIDVYIIQDIKIANITVMIFKLLYTTVVLKSMLCLRYKIEKTQNSSRVSKCIDDYQACRLGHATNNNRIASKASGSRNVFK